MFNFLKKKVNSHNKNSLILLTSNGETLINSKTDVFLGRDPAECDIVIKNNNVGKKHMHIIFSDGKWFAEDLNSTNGTWINGEKIPSLQPMVLNSGDRICIALSTVYYFMEKPEVDNYVEDVDYEKNIGEVEYIINSIKKENNGHAMESKYFGRLIDLFCETPLYVRATMDNTKPESERFQVVLIKPAKDEIIPVFTRKCHADAFGKYGDVYKLNPERFMVVLRQLNEHIVINPNLENRLIIPKDIFKMVIFEEFMEKFKAKADFQKYREKNDILGALVCRYNMASQQLDRQQLLLAILEYMSENAAWVPCSANYSKEDFEKIKNSKQGDVFSFENTKLKPDILKHTSGKLYFPIFSQKDEAPEDYAKNFSWINMPIVRCCILARNNPNCSGIIVNAFTNSHPITNELIDIVLSRYCSKENLINDEQMACAEREPNGGLRLGLDNGRLYFLTVFIEEDKIISYCIDREAANDSHYKLEPFAAYQLSQLLDKEYGEGNFVDNLRKFFSEKGDCHLVTLMEDNKIIFEQLHFDEY